MYEEILLLGNNLDERATHFLKRGRWELASSLLFLLEDEDSCVELLTPSLLGDPLSDPQISWLKLNRIQKILERKHSNSIQNSSQFSVPSSPLPLPFDNLPKDLSQNIQFEILLEIIFKTQKETRSNHKKFVEDSKREICEWIREGYNDFRLKDSDRNSARKSRNFSSLNQLSSEAYLFLIQSFYLNQIAAFHLIHFIVKREKNSENGATRLSGIYDLNSSFNEEDSPVFITTLKNVCWEVTRMMMKDEKEGNKELGIPFLLPFCLESINSNRLEELISWEGKSVFERIVISLLSSPFSENQKGIRLLSTFLQKKSKGNERNHEMGEQISNLEERNISSWWSSLALSTHINGTHFLESWMNQFILFCEKRDTESTLNLLNSIRSGANQSSQVSIAAIQRLALILMWDSTIKEPLNHPLCQFFNTIIQFDWISFPQIKSNAEGENREIWMIVENAFQTALVEIKTVCELEKLGHLDPQMRKNLGQKSLLKMIMDHCDVMNIPTEGFESLLSGSQNPAEEEDLNFLKSFRFLRDILHTSSSNEKDSTLNLQKWMNENENIAGIQLISLLYSSLFLCSSSSSFRFILSSLESMIQKKKVEISRKEGQNVELWENMQKIIEETIWKFNILSTIDERWESDFPLLEGMLASPRTLYLMALRSKKRELLQQILEHYRGDKSSFVDDSSLLQSKKMSFSFDSLKENGNINQSEEEMSEEDILILKLDLFLNKLTSIWKGFVGLEDSLSSNSLKEAIGGIESKDSNQLFAEWSSFLESGDTLDSNSSPLHPKNSSGKKQELAIVSMWRKTTTPSSIDIQKIVKLLSNSENGNNSLYTLPFLQYILEMFKQLCEEKGSPLDVLKKSPTRIIRGLIANEKDRRKAEILSKSLDLEIIDLLSSQICSSMSSFDRMDLQEELEIVKYIGDQKNSDSSFSILLSLSIAFQLLLPFGFPFFKHGLEIKGKEKNEENIARHWALSKLISYSVLTSKHNSEESSHSILKNASRNNQWESILNGEDYGKKIHLLKSLWDAEEFDEENQVVYSFIEDLISQGKLENVLQIIDNPLTFLWLDHSTILEKVAELSVNDEEMLWKCLIRIKDKVQASRHILRYLPYLGIDKAVDALSMSKCHLQKLKSQDDSNENDKSISELLEQIEMKYSILNTLREILEMNWKDWGGWQRLYKTCETKPLELIRKLLKRKRHDLARKLVAVFPQIGGEMSMEIEESYLSDLLQRSQYDKALQVLKSLGGDSSIQIAKKLINCAQSNDASLILVEFLLDHHLYDGDKEFVAVLKDRRSSLRIINRLPSSLQKQCEKLIDQPVLLLESLLMSQYFTELPSLFQSFPELRRDDLVLKYAQKAMQTLPSSSSDIKHKYFGDDSEFSGESDLKHLIAEKGVNYLLGGMNSDVKPTFNLTSTLDGNKNVGSGMESFVIDTEYTGRRSDLDFAKMSMTSSGLWILTGDESVDEELRKGHFYPASPSVSLAKNLLELCGNLQKSGEKCIEICNELSQQLVHFGSNSSFKTDSLVIVSMIQEMLIYAKLLFVKANNNNNAEDNKNDEKGGGTDMGISLCDTFLSYVELLQSLVICKALPSSFTLTDFNSNIKSRQLRDKLISEDRLKLALDVASKCGIESEPIWISWGLSLLKIGKYTEAKEKFNSCLTSSEHSRNTSVDLNELLNDIISTLESPNPPEPDGLREWHTSLSQTKHKSMRIASEHNDLSMESYLSALNMGNTKSELVKGSKRTYQSPLDGARLMQCIFYLSKYGTPEMLVRFWMRHQLLEDACRYMFVNNMPHSMFIKEIAQHCLYHDWVSELQAVLTKIDPNLSKSQDYLLSLCKYLNDKKAFHALLNFQVFMKDEARAGLTCIMIYLDQKDYNDQIVWLEKAKEHFELGAGGKSLLKLNITRDR
eukprot:TRINITY_DN5935_c0_g1_i1.p1 TRINITY_DN5935_c0_g1~~TRINITY_DN5935_c0_g1_i1.p1  ORF type:complete len:1897 (+),score=781.85 TRINITY_DN5935_c0_g1_i1:251-5941(+)